jgi:hypothetical protein
MSSKVGFSARRAMSTSRSASPTAAEMCEAVSYKTQQL